MKSPFKRALLLVMDGVGIGELPDAADFGDQGAHTLGHVANHQSGLQLPNFATLGLGNIEPIEGVPADPKPRGCYGKMAETGLGKDSTAGHWELCGVLPEKPFRTYPDGFPNEIMRSFCERTGLKGYLGNRPASGTGIIAELGEEHMKTGHPIVYTSADPVFQIAAHEEVIPLSELYRLCELALELTEPIGIGRAIARPFRGLPGDFVRTAARKDFSVVPPVGNLLDKLVDQGSAVYGVGKVDNLFAGRGFTKCEHTRNNQHGVETIFEFLAATEKREQSSLIFANLVDFDTTYGHRNDPEGFATALMQLDAQIPKLAQQLQQDDLLIITADHGNDPTHPGSDHTREYVPLLVTTAAIWSQKNKGVDLGLRNSFADVGATLAEFFAVTPLKHGKSFFSLLRAS